MADEVNAGAGAGSGAGTGGGSSAPTTMTAAEIAAPGGDVAFLEQETPEVKAPDAAGGTEGAEKPAAKEAEAGGETKDEIDLTPLEEGKPAWLAKLTPEEREQAEKDLKANAFPENWQFKDDADREEFFKSLPGGREQVQRIQMLSAEIAEDDTALEANTPEGLAGIAEKYLSMTPDGGVQLLRTAAQHMAKASPESWKQISHELVNSTLHAAGIGQDIAGIVSAIAEMRAAVNADDGEAFGAAAGKLLGAPKAAPKEDPALKAAADKENQTKAEKAEAQQSTWQLRSERSGEKIDSHISGAIKEALTKVLPASVAEKERVGLIGDISKEIMSQLFADKWIASNLMQLIGYSTSGPKGVDYGKAQVTASQADWDKATEIMTKAVTPKLVARAASKIVSAWSKDRATNNSSAREKARNTAQRTDIGGGKTASSGKGRQPLTAEQLKNMTDEEFLNY
jgi:hypothetical protein